MLTRRYATASAVVFRDLIINWGIERLGNHCPDTCIVFGVQNKERVWSEFSVVREGVRPALVIEVVSPRYRREDRQIKVKEYAQAGVREYIIFDRRRQRGEFIEEVLGYRLTDDIYLPMIPNEEGAVLAETVGLWLGLQAGDVVMVDAETGERLLNSLELEQRLAQTQQQATEAELRATEAEQRNAQLLELLRAQGIDPDQIG